MRERTHLGARRLGSFGLALTILVTQVSLIVPVPVAARTTVAPGWRSGAITAQGHLGGGHYDLWLSGTTLYTANGSSIQSFDVSDPTLPSELGEHLGFESSYNACAASGDVLYTQAGAEVQAFDVGDPSSMEPTGTLAMTSPGYSGGDAEIDGDLLYLPQEYDGLHVFDISGGPKAMTQIQKLDAPGTNEYWWNAEAAGGWLYAWRSGNGFTGVDIYDAHVRPLTKSASLPLGSSGLADLALEGNRLYEADSAPAGSFRVVDVSNPAAPSVLGSLSLGNTSHLAVHGTYAYACAAKTITVVDATNPSSPSVAGTVALPGDVRGTLVNGDSLYVLTDAGFSIFDVSTPSSPTLLGSHFALQNVSTVAASDSGALFIGSEYFPNLWIADASDPTSVTPLGHVTMPGTGVLGVSATGNLLGVVSKNGSGTRYLSMLNVTDPASTSVLDSQSITGTFDSIRLSGSRALVFGDGGLALWDVSNPAAPALASTLASLGKVIDVAVAGSRAFVTYDASSSDYGVASVDISDMANPLVLDTITMGDVTRGMMSSPFDAIAVSGNRVFVNGYGKGIQVLDVTDPANLTWAGGETGHYAEVARLLVSGDRLWAAEGSGGSRLRLLDISGIGTPLELSTSPVRAADACLLAGSIAVGSDYEVITFRENKAPVALNDGPYTVSVNTTLTLAATGVLGNDVDADGDALTAVAGSGPSHGELTLAANGGLTYRPADNWHGTDTFTYRASDGALQSAPATSTITVLPPNSAPVAVNDAATCTEGDSLSVAAPGVLGNDADGEGDPLVASLVADAAHGVLMLNPNGSYTYTPAMGWTGTDTFTYRAYDGRDFSQAATVSITVTPHAVGPTAPQTSSLAGTVISLGAPVPGASVTLSGAGGNATTGADGTFTIAGIPEGAYQLTVTKTGYRAKGVAVSIVAGSKTTQAITLDRIVSRAVIALKPTKKAVTYKRRKGVAKFTLSASMKGWGSLALARRITYLQTSTNNRSWKSSYKLTATSNGTASKTFRIRTKQARYYRWYVPARSQTNLATYSTSVKVTVK